MTETGLITTLDIIESIWSILILGIYGFSAFLFYKLIPKFKKSQNKWVIIFIMSVCIAFSIAFLINFIADFSIPFITITTAYVIAVIRPLMFLAGCSLAVLSYLIKAGNYG